ncbi:LolA family protein [Streptomyces sp. KLOTTS4A1]|uniref:LolA family protein n=1 Tax=Streptomyces sp. KLOTTS4A1 TaxID=3390996 RepID=UPI0039F5B08C
MAPNAPYEPAPVRDEADDLRSGRRKAARYLVPAAVAGVAALTIGLVPAFAGSGDPDLPEISAQELIEKIAASKTEQFSGNVKITTDLGLPAIASFAESFTSGLGEDGADGKGTPDPQSKLLELATGTHHLRVAADGPEKQKLTILGKGSDFSLIHNGEDSWAYDSGSKEAVHTEGEPGEAHEGPEVPEQPATPAELAEEVLEAADPSTKLSVDGTSRIAGQEAYRLKLEPKQSGSTIGSVTIDVDADTYVPLKFALHATDGGKPVIDAGFTKVDFSQPAASEFTLPKGTKVTEAEDLEKDFEDDFEDFGKDFEKEFGKDGFGKGDKHPWGEGEGADFAENVNVIGEGWSTILAFDTGGQGMPDADEMKDAPAGLSGLLDSFGDKVSGDFGSGTVFKTRLINVLMTEDGKVYAGAVTKDALVKAADEAAK